MKPQHLLTAAILLCIGFAVGYSVPRPAPEPKVGNVYAMHLDRTTNLYALTNGFGMAFGTQSVVITVITKITNGQAWAAYQSFNIDGLKNVTPEKFPSQFGPVEHFKTYHGTHYNYLAPQ